MSHITAKVTTTASLIKGTNVTLIPLEVAANEIVTYAVTSVEGRRTEQALAIPATQVRIDRQPTDADIAAHEDRCAAYDRCRDI